MGGVISDITDAVGLTNYKQQKDAVNLAKQSSSQSYALTKDQLDFQKQQYNDWKSIYGPIQKNLGDFYANINPNIYASKAKEEISQEFNTTMEKLKTSFAQRGITYSGIYDKMETSTQMQEALSKANIDANKHDIVAQKQMQFLGLGLGQGSQMLGTMGNIASSGANAQAGITSSYNSSSTALGVSNSNAIGGLIGAGIGAWAMK